MQSWVHPYHQIWAFPQNTESLLWSWQAGHCVKGCFHMQRHPRTLGSWERAEHCSFCPEVTGVCNTHSLAHSQHPPGTHERAEVHIWDSAHCISVTDFKVAKSSCRNCYFISLCTQNLEEGLLQPSWTLVTPCPWLWQNMGTPPCLCKALHREHFLPLHTHHTQLMHWNTLDTVTTVCTVSL